MNSYIKTKVEFEKYYTKVFYKLTWV